MLTREQALDELEDLGTVAHALCVEYLFIGCALGNGADPPGDPAGSATQLTDARRNARSMAITEMHQLRRINAVLSAAGRRPTVGRATRLTQDGSPAIALAQPGSAQLDGMLDRELAVARAVDARYGALLATVDPEGTPVFDEKLSFQLTTILAIGGRHETSFAELRDDLAGLAPSDYLRVTSDTAGDELGRGLRDLSDRYYGVIVSALRLGFSDHDLEGEMIDNRGGEAMGRLDEVNSLLAAHGLLPAFTLP